MKNMKKKKIPKFRNDDEEREFWEKNDSTEYIDYSKAKIGIFPNLKPTTHSISIRIPDHLLYRLKTIANKKDVSYQSLLKVYLAEKLKEELGR